MQPVTANYKESLSITKNCSNSKLKVQITGKLQNKLSFIIILIRPAQFLNLWNICCHYVFFSINLKKKNFYIDRKFWWILSLLKSFVLGLTVKMNVCNL